MFSKVSPLDLFSHCIYSALNSVPFLTVARTITYQCNTNIQRMCVFFFSFFFFWWELGLKVSTKDKNRVKITFEKSPKILYT